MKGCGPLLVLLFCLFEAGVPGESNDPPDLWEELERLEVMVLSLEDKVKILEVKAGASNNEAKEQRDLVAGLQKELNITKQEMKEHAGSDQCDAVWNCIYTPSVSIPVDTQLRPLLGSTVVVPCHIHYRLETITHHSTHTIKWTHITEDNSTLILTASSGEVTVSAEYEGHVTLVNYTLLPSDATMEITEVRSKDSGMYRCEVIYGAEERHACVDIWVQGIVFHYNIGRYTMTFEEAKAACIENSASIATPVQLEAAFHDGLHQCDAGWVSDKTVRYPIVEPRHGCDGDLEESPGVRSYGERDAELEHWDVYCFAAEMSGRVFYAEDANVTFDEAAEQCAKEGGRLATTGELYLAWKEGMDVCRAGWLADQTLRYPINIANDVCGGGLIGVMTLDPNCTDARHDAVCFREGEVVGQMGYREQRVEPVEELDEGHEEEHELWSWLDLTDSNVESVDSDMYIIAELTHTLEELETRLSAVDVDDLKKRLRALEAHHIRLYASEDMLDDLIDTLEDKVDDLTSRLSVSEDKVEDQTIRLGVSEDKVEELKDQSADCHAKLSAIETRLIEIESQAEELKMQNPEERTTIAFSAADGGDGRIAPSQTNTTFIYRNVTTNVGLAYDESTGIFTAPVAGVYFFTFFYHTGDRLDATLYLYQNSQRMAVTSDQSTGSEGARNGGNGVTLQLQQGDQVYVYMAVNTDVWDNDTYGHTTFSGFLLQ